MVSCSFTVTVSGGAGAAVPTAGLSAPRQRPPSSASPPARRSFAGEKPPVPPGCDALVQRKGSRQTQMVSRKSHNHKSQNSPQKGDEEEVRRKSFCSLGTGDTTIPLFSNKPANAARNQTRVSHALSLLACVSVIK